MSRRGRPCGAPRHARTAMCCGPPPRCTAGSTGRDMPTPAKRRSIERESTVQGTGLHTGASTGAVFRPGTAGRGIVFRRSVLSGTPEVPARQSEVEALERGTAIGHGEATIHTVEHLLAAVAAHEIDDLTIELTGPEPPILDGSVQPYFDALATAEPASVGGEPAVLTVTAPFTVTDKDAAY